MQALALENLNNSNQASIAKGIERDVKSLQHEMWSMHSLKRDVEDLHASTSSTVRTVQADLQQLREDSSARNRHTIDLQKDVDSVKSTLQQSRAAEQSLADMQSKMTDMRRDMTMQNIRIDKANTSMQDMHSKLAGKLGA
jgi:hypothetical protein